MYIYQYAGIDALWQPAKCCSSVAALLQRCCNLSEGSLLGQHEATSASRHCHTYTYATYVSPYSTYVSPYATYVFPYATYVSPY